MPVTVEAPQTGRKTGSWYAESRMNCAFFPILASNRRNLQSL
jgi:hypothetical protein